MGWCKSQHGAQRTATLSKSLSLICGTRDKQEIGYAGQNGAVSFYWPTFTALGWTDNTDLG